MGVLRRVLSDAGFAHAEATVTPWVAGSLEQTRADAAFFKAQLPGVARTALAQGWLDRAAVAAIPAELDAGVERPDAFVTMTWCPAIG